MCALFFRGYGERGLQEKQLKEHILTTAFVVFTWAASWGSNAESKQVRVRVNNALDPQRRIPLPENWDVALGALGKLKDARQIPPAELPLNIMPPTCDLVGVPKPVLPALAGLAPGACVALSEGGSRVNYVLVAHVSGDVWFCSTGGKTFGETIVPETVWHGDFCAPRDVVRDAWDEALRSKLRVAPRVKAGYLRTLMREHPAAFDALVAHKTWEAEELRASAGNRPVDFAAAGAMYERNPFVFVSYAKWQGAGRLSHLQVEYLWRWHEGGVPRHERTSVRLDNAVGGKVPRPERLVVDYALRRRLEEAVARETNRSYCPCRYLGLQTETGYEPDPAKWPDVSGPKSLQHI